MRPWIALVPLALFLGCESPPAPAPAAPAPAAPAPAAADARPTHAADAWIAKCLKFPAGLTVIRSEAELQALPREGPPMNEGCPEALPSPRLNFDEHALVVAYQEARCSGSLTRSGRNFLWGERGDCEKLELLKGTLVVPQAEADEVRLVKLEQ